MPLNTIVTDVRWFSVCNAALKEDLMATLNKEVRMLDEDSWMFEGPRSRIHLITRPGGLLSKHAETMKLTQKRNQNASIK
ncbi:putative protein SAMBA [Helianthus annuus]|nr:putative protein SAMBA [Helianthus annuus]KAJ0496986.1 putative protein SAMBA [Helianthus annuus]KAJ0663017.1 putative protein SAMBA [Helianthus annuus]KAJ0670512.1 putative protein SAMBA [Helianthus annuus]